MELSSIEKGKRNTCVRPRFPKNALGSQLHHKKIMQKMFQCIHIEKKGRTLHNKSPEKAIILNKTHQ